jgi:hypothetical protein
MEWIAPKSPNHVEMTVSASAQLVDWQLILVTNDGVRHQMEAFPTSITIDRGGFSRFGDDL